MNVLCFLLGIPVAIECLGGILAFRDLVRLPGMRARAIERLILPTFLLGLVLWIALPGHGIALGAAFAFVVLWQILAHVAGRWLIRSGRYCADSFDTEV
jgi:hypothetical protein